jgi:uncharacterized phage protein (TIGR01671 family)
MSSIKYREPLTDSHGNFSRFHYWGVIDGKFVPPINEYGISTKESQQYTGEKDSNDTEIYQGDIVHQVRKDDCFGGDNEVEVVLIKTPVYWDLTNRPSGGPEGHYPIIKMEVIGNTHQNPELVK